MITFLALIALVWVIISNKSLSNRLDTLELKIKNGSNANVTSAPVNMAPSVTTMDASVASSQVSQRTEEPNKFTNWLKEDWLMKLGAVLFIMGFGWFVSYAFINNWIGPVGRISIGIIAGIIIMALGFKRMMKHPHQGAVFMALGAGMAMLTIFAGRSIYGFFTPATAVMFDFLIAAFVSYASYKFNMQSLAYVAQVLAFVTPLLAAGQTNSIFLFSYLFFISLATLFLASVTGWRDLIGSSLIFVGMYSLPYILGSGNTFYSLGYGGVYKTDAPIILNFAYLFSMLYLFAGMFAVIKKGVQNAKDEITLASLNGLFLFLWIYNVAPKEWGVMLFAIWAIVFAVCSFMAFKLSSKLAPFYAYGAVAVAFIAAATSLQLDGPALVMAFTVEVFLLVICVLALTNNVKATISAAWLYVVPGLLSFASMSRYAFSQELFTKDLYVLVMLAVALIFSGRFIVWSSKQKQGEQEIYAGSVLVIAGTLYVGYIIWQFIHIMFLNNPDLATMSALIIYTIFGMLAYFAGLYGNDMARRTYGVALLSFVVIRLVFIDVWHMELFGRVVTFLAIGVLLMSTAFLTKKKKHETLQ